MKKIFLCALSNVSSGNCPEDCAFCTQSAHNVSNIDKYRQKPIDTVVQEAIFAHEHKANGFCLVTSGLRLNKHKKKYILDLANAIKKRANIRLIACNGLASYEDLVDLKNGGIDAYNHNLETQEDFYTSICTTHSWKERFQTCLNVKKAKLMLICGGIFGLGETKEQRTQLFHSLKELQPQKIPLNFFIADSGLKISKPVMSKEEALEIIAQAREHFPKAIIMVAGGRELVFKDEWTEIFAHGANSIIAGGYLTSSGNGTQRDIEQIQKAGYRIG